MNGKGFIVFVLLVSLVITLALGVAHTRVALPLPDTDVGATSYDNRQADGRQAFVYNSWKEQDSRTLNQEASGSQFTFAVTADMRGYSGQGQYDTQEYFRGACEAIAALGSGAFMVSPGDIDPPADVEWTIERYIGHDYIWYPVVGNHELPGSGNESYPGSNMDWLRGYDYGAVNPGPSGCPETTYSFDYENAHFVMLNEYCDTTGDTVTDGDVPDHLYDWLVGDLSATDKTHIFVFGHEPAYPQPDADNGRLRHLGDSLDGHPANRDRLWNLLRDKGVVAYICGHTHNYSGVEIDDVWQLDAGHARGLGDTGARSTFILIHVDGDVVTFKTYRDDANGGPYTLAHSGTLAGARIYLPLVIRARSVSSKHRRDHQYLDHPPQSERWSRRDRAEKDRVSFLIATMPRPVLMI